MQLPAPNQPCSAARSPKEPLDRVDAHGAVELGPVAAGFAGVVADAAVNCREGIVAQNGFPGGAVLAGLGEIEPSLDVLAGGQAALQGGSRSP